MIRILFVGDVVGAPGRRILHQLPQLIQEKSIDHVIINGENSAHGKGITSKIYRQMIDLGASCVTLGNHAFAKQEIISHFMSCRKLICPLNMEVGQGLRHSLCLTTKEGPLRVVNIMGQVFMNQVKESPFSSFERLLEESDHEMVFVDFHGEATAEKQTFFEVFKHRCVAIVGTHTHVQTADEKVKDGCAYISDVGMTGAYDSILGRDIDEVIRHNKGEKTHYTIAKGRAMLNGVIIDLENGRAKAIERLNILEN